MPVPREPFLELHLAPDGEHGRRRFVDWHLAAAVLALGGVELVVDPGLADVHAAPLEVDVCQPSPASSERRSPQ